jgi:putative NIF3 family GTP cyclohydrolase 1 type 2
VSDAVGAWIDLVHALYPPSDAADWDHPGLQVGDPRWTVDRVLVTLDVTSAVLEEAASGPATLVLAHHPILLHPLRALTPDTAAGALALRAARAGIAVAAAHTNLDAADDGAGTSDPVASALGLIGVRRVAVLGGSGTSAVPDALRAGADVLVTGDVRHHVALDALELGLALVDAGHHATEVAAMPAFAANVSRAAVGRGLSADVVLSTVTTTPWEQA